MGEVWSLGGFYAIYFDARVGADGCAACATGACLGFCHDGEMIAFVVNLYFLQGNHATWACFHAYAASFAAFFIHFDRTSYFNHNYIILF